MFDKTKFAAKKRSFWSGVLVLSGVTMLGLAGCNGGGSGPIVPTPIGTPSTTATPNGTPNATPSGTPTMTATPIGTPSAPANPLSSLPGRLVVSELNGSGSGYKMYSVRLDGTQRRELGGGFQPALSPDGKTLAFTSSRGIELLDLTSGARRFLAANGRAASWSFDGTRLAFENFPTLNAQPPSYVSGISIINADGSGRKALTQGEGGVNFGDSRSDTQPTWHPSGDYITCVRSTKVGLKSSTEMLNVDLNGQETPLPLLGRQEGGDLDYPDWNPDGKRLLFTDDQTLSIATNGRVMLMFIDDSGRTVLFGPHWSPDGRYLAVATARGNTRRGIAIFDGRTKIGTVPGTESVRAFDWSNLP